MPLDQWIDSNLTTILHLRMSSLLAETVFGLEDGVIKSSKPVSSLTPTLYSAEDIFQVLNPALSNSSIQISISSTINDNSFSGIYGDVEPAALRNLMASAFYEYNWGTDWNQTSDAVPSMYVNGYYAVERFRLIIAAYTLILFTALTVGELLWSVSVVHLNCIGDGVTPIRSVFPEWDFATKCVSAPPRQTGTGMNTLMRGLAQASSKEVIDRIKSERIKVKSNYDIEVESLRGSADVRGYVPRRTGLLDLRTESRDTWF